MRIWARKGFSDSHFRDHEIWRAGPKPLCVGTSLSYAYICLLGSEPLSGGGGGGGKPSFFLTLAEYRWVRTRKLSVSLCAV